METRVTALEAGLSEVRKEVAGLREILTTALLGSYDGKPGIRQTLDHSLEASRINSAKLDTLSLKFAEHSNQLDGLRLDRSKLTGAIVTCSVLWAAFIAVMGLLIKYWR